MTMIICCRSIASNTMQQSAKMMFSSSNVFAVRTAAAVSTAGCPSSVSPSRPNASHSCCQYPRSCHHHRLWCRNMSSNSSNSVEPDWVRTAIQKMIMDQQQPSPPENGGETSTQSSLTASMDRNAVTSMNGSTNASPSTSAIFDNSDLEKTLQSLQNQLQEAELCIQDCYECVHSNESQASIGERSEMLQKEIDAADHSIDMAVAHFVDLLDAKQHQQSSCSSSSSNNSTSTSASTDVTGGNDSYNNINKAIPTEDLVKRIKHLRSEIAKLKLVQQQSIVTNPTSSD